MSLSEQPNEQFLADVFQENKDATALVSNTAVYSYSELLALCHELYHYLNSNNLLIDNARIGIKLAKREEYVIAYLSSLIYGYCLVPLEVEASDDSVASLCNDASVTFTLSVPYIENLNEKPAPLFPKRCDLSKLHLITYTSGTTAKPKGIMHTGNNLICSARAFNTACDLAKVNLLHVLPIHYMAGYLNSILSPLLSGGTVYLAPVLSPMNLKSFWQGVVNHDINTLWLTPGMLEVLTVLTRSEENISAVKGKLDHIFVGTSALSRKQKEAFYDKFGLYVQQSYGVTEVLLVSVEKPNVCELSVGHLLPSVELAPLTEENDEVIIYSPSKYLGYINGVPAEPLEGYATGDMGALAQTGELQIKGRVDDLIIKGGININPLAIEEALSKNQAIDDVVVASRPHDFWGQEIVAYVVSNSMLSKESLQSFCKTHLPKHAIPSVFYSVESLPRNFLGKVQKKKLTTISKTEVQ